MTDACFFLRIGHFTRCLNVTCTIILGLDAHTHTYPVTFCNIMTRVSDSATRILLTNSISYIT